VCCGRRDFAAKFAKRFRHSAQPLDRLASEWSEMSEKLGIGDTFPKVTINLVDGRTLDLPDGLDAKYRIFLFYRGHW
jgi:hypothetical protein